MTLRHRLGHALTDLFAGKPFYSSVEVRGAEHLPSEGRTLYISNHADIIREAALINKALRGNERATAAAVVGENLYANRYTRFVMGFIPTVVAPRARGKGGVVAARIERALSEGQPVWVAQSRGRSKDGRNITQPALLRNLAKAAGQPVDEYLASTHVVPVAVSAEYDPAIVEKARQHPSLLAREKRWYSDALSCWHGLIGRKGGVVVDFGAPLAPVRTAWLATRAVDNHIITHYRLWETNEVAYEERSDAGPLRKWDRLPVDLDYLQSRHTGLHKRIQRLEPELQPVVMSIYAMPKHQFTTHKNS